MSSQNKPRSDVKASAKTATSSEDDTPPKSDSRFVLYSFILLGICINCYFNSLEAGFCFDDAKAIQKNHDLRPYTPIYEIFQNDFWGTPMHKDTSHKSYRPICILTFRLNYAIHELEPAGYHFGNMMLHWVLCLIIMYSFQTFLTQWMSFILATLFMVHPVHTEAVTGTVGRAEVLCGIFALLSLKSYEKGSGYRKKTVWMPIFLTVLLIVIATLCKEQGVTVLAVCCVYEVLWLQKVTLWEGLDLARMLLTRPSKLPSWFVWSLKRMMFLLITTIGLMAMRIMVMGAQLPFFTSFDNPPASAPTPARQLTQWYLLPINAWLLLYPYPLLCDYSMGTIPFLQSFSDPRNLATMNFVTFLGVLSYYALTGNTKTARQVSMALAFLVFPFLPASNLLFPVGFVVAERILYLPSLGFSMLVVIGLQKLLMHERFKKLVYAALIVTVAFHAGKTARRNIDWKSERSLFQSGLQITRKNAKVWNNVGHSYERERKPEIALQYFKQATIVQPDDGGAWINVARAYQALELDVKAMEHFRKAELLMPAKRPGGSRRLDPKYLSIYVSMAAILRKDPARRQDALELLKKAIRMWPEFEDAFVNMGDLLVEMGRIDDAERILTKLLAFAPRNEIGLYNMGVIAIKKNDTMGAKEWFERCLHFHPNSPHAMFSLTAISEKQSGIPNEEAMLDKLMVLATVETKNYKLFAKIGLIFKKLEDLPNAALYLETAVEINDTFATAIFNLGHVYKLQRENEKAIQQFEKYIELNRDNINAWVLLGDLYVSYRTDYNAAWKCFEEAKRIAPDSLQVEHNFCVILVKKQQLQEAKQCFEALLDRDEDNMVKTNYDKLIALIAKREKEFSFNADDL